MKIRAAILTTVGAQAPYSQSRPLAIATVDLEPPGREEVLVRIAAAGLCHSDLSVMNGDRPRPVPMVLGHEAAGVVEAVGEGVHDLEPGDHVILVFVPSCGHCMPCAEGRPALCEPGARANTAGTLLAGRRRLSLDGRPLHHHLGCSAFAEAAVVSRRSIVKIDKDLPLQDAALFGCGVLTGVGAVVNTAGVQAGSVVAVVGLGGVGLSSVMGAAACGARQVIAIDLSAQKLKLAAALGATDCLDAADADLVEKVIRLTRGGADYAIEMAGSVKAFDLAYRITRRGGTTVTAGLPAPTAAWNLSPAHLVGEERTIKGSYIGSCVPARDLPRYIELHKRGKLPVEALKNDPIPLERINEGFDWLRDGKVVRQVVTMA